MRYKQIILRFSAYLSLVAFMMQLLLVVVSWMLTAIMPELKLRSILCSEGLRWFFGTFVDNIKSIVIVWILLLGMAIGVVRQSNLLYSVLNYKQTTDYERMALFVVLWEIAGIVVVVVFLAFVPHAILLSALGTLLPSSFSASIVPILSFSLMSVAITYGYVTGANDSIDKVFSSMCNGIAIVAPVIVTYIVIAEFYCSLIWSLEL